MWAIMSPIQAKIQTGYSWHQTQEQYSHLLLGIWFAHKKNYKSYSWLARCWNAVLAALKLKVVMRPTGVVQYWRQPDGGLYKMIKQPLQILGKFNKINKTKVFF
jgi:hypothetical protein